MPRKPSKLAPSVMADRPNVEVKDSYVNPTSGFLPVELMPNGSIRFLSVTGANNPVAYYHSGDAHAFTRHYRQTQGFKDPSRVFAVLSPAGVVIAIM